jgi:hypothetical protein
MEGAHFTEEETALFLKGVCLEDHSFVTQQKLQQWGLVDKLSQFPRNLIALRNKIELHQKTNMEDVKHNRSAG